MSVVRGSEPGGYPGPCSAQASTQVVARWQLGHLVLGAEPGGAGFPGGPVGVIAPRHIDRGEETIETDAVVRRQDSSPCSPAGPGASATARQGRAASSALSSRSSAVRARARRRSRRRAPATGAAGRRAPHASSGSCSRSAARRATTDQHVDRGVPPGQLRRDVDRGRGTGQEDPALRGQSRREQVRQQRAADATPRAVEVGPGEHLGAEQVDALGCVVEMVIGFSSPRRRRQPNRSLISAGRRMWPQRRAPRAPVASTCS